MLKIAQMSDVSLLQLIFYLLVVCIAFNLLVGLMIDSISDIRQREEYLTEIIKTRCFICDLKKTDFETRKLDYNQHVNEEHNMIAYVYYCMYL